MIALSFITSSTQVHVYNGLDPNLSATRPKEGGNKDFRMDKKTKSKEQGLEKSYPQPYSLLFVPCSNKVIKEKGAKTKDWKNTPILTLCSLFSIACSLF